MLTIDKQYTVDPKAQPRATKQPVMHSWHVDRTRYLERAATGQANGLTAEELADVELVKAWLQTQHGTAERAWAAEPSLLRGADSVRQWLAARA